ncbi:MAG TPA: hypothetical protein DEP18_04930 [Flavobacteriales bacterium]|nr:hypothetical protein [Flavobacteriales bacterium]HCA83109.1 hypothetical protein [Flavobacteriales bacterium]HRE75459.1 hypothetical protein [Flavobacteriales bacterium]HRE96120.1 hypothetical protein [Flavobacteriales bacterium]HRJ34992.1 hypothetical protein [Flavobacteriales bacterium]
MKRILFPSLILLSILFTSCKKEEGVGGMATIKGKIWMKEYTGGVLIDQYFAPDHDVFIIYGEGNTYYDDKISTSYDGSYEFRYLRPGRYKIFTYTKHEITGNLSPEIRSVEISGKKDVIVLDDITVKD